MPTIQPPSATSSTAVTAATVPLVAKDAPQMMILDQDRLQALILELVDGLTEDRSIRASFGLEPGSRVDYALLDGMGRRITAAATAGRPVRLEDVGNVADGRLADQLVDLLNCRLEDAIQDAPAP